MSAPLIRSINYNVVSMILAWPTANQSEPGLGARWLRPDHRSLVAAVLDRVLRKDPEYLRYAPSGLDPDPQRLTDFRFGSAGELDSPEAVFDKLRWGGLLVFVSSDAGLVARRSADFHARGGFVVERGPASLRARLWGLPIPLPGPAVHYFVARKVCLVQPGKTTDRFTFDVQLIRRRGTDSDNPYAVLKQVPTWHSVYDRLRQRFPNSNQEVIANRARKLVDRVFPVFLTREYAFLQLLGRDLPPPYNDKVPRALAVEKDERGMVRKLVMTWLRLGCPRHGPLSQLEFARQSADLVRVLHDIVRIIHLDLRLDNFVITPEGVGFVDFGSAVRVGEDLSQSPMLRSLFDEMMSTSQIQRMLGKMKRSGQLTSRVITDKQGKVDKAIDLFYLAVQMNKPLLNPDFAGLVEYDPESESAKKLSLLTDAILRPKNPERPGYITAQDVLSAILRIQEKVLLGKGDGNGIKE